MNKLLVLLAFATVATASLRPPINPEGEHSWIDRSETIWDESECELPASRKCLSGLLSSNYDKQIKKVNKFLTSRIPDSSPASNFELAKKCIATETDSNLVAGLIRFANLEKLEDDSFKCSDAAYDILRDIDIATYGKRTRKDKSLGRVEKVFFQVAAEHSVYCLRETEKKQTAKWNRLDESDRTTAEIFTNEITSRFDTVNSPRYDSRNEKLELDEVEGIVFVETLIDETGNVFRHTLDAMKNIARSDKDKKFTPTFNDERSKVNMILVEKMIDMHNHYIVAICKKIRQVLQTFYEHTQVDMKLLGLGDRVDPNIKSVLSKWSSYQFCSLLLKESIKFQKGMIKAV